MEYRVIEYFTDLRDKNHAYNTGDIYPRKGYKPSEERIQALLSDNNVRKRPIIKAETAETTEPETEEIAETVAEAAEDETAIEDDSESETEEEVEKKPRKRKKREE